MPRVFCWYVSTGVPPRSAIAWGVVFGSWTLLARLHLSEEERLTLIARFSYLGDGHYGLDDAARALFDHPLSEVSLAEAGTLVVLMKNPSLYDKPDRLMAARDRFLSRYQKG
jgi:membrane carboxypeptidase/penicillin-binding protein